MAEFAVSKKALDFFIKLNYFVRAIFTFRTGAKFKVTTYHFGAV